MKVIKNKVIIHFFCFVLKKRAWLNDPEMKSNSMTNWSNQQRS